MSLIGAAAGSISSVLLSNVLMLLTGILTARILGPEGKGVYVFAVLIPQLASNICALGLGSSNTYFISKDRQEASKAIGTSLGIVLGLGVVATIIISTIVKFWGESWDIDSVVLIGVWAIPGLLGYVIVQRTMLGMGRYWEFNILNILDRSIVLGLFFVWGFQSRAGPEMFCMLYVASAILSFVLSLALLLPQISYRMEFSCEYALRALRYGLRGHVGWVATLVNYRLGMFLVHILGGARALGLYSVAVSIAETLWLLPNCVSVVLMPELASGRHEAAKTTPTVCRVLTPLTIISVLGLAGVSKPLINLLYGSDFELSLRPLLLLLPGIAAYAFVRVLSADLASRGRPGLNSIVSGTSLALTLVLNLLLIPRFSAAGAAVASTVAYCAGAVLTLFFYTQISGARPLRLLIPHQGDGALACKSLSKLLRRQEFMKGANREGRLD